jgi:flagellar biosynthetic protein FliQ
MTEEIVVEILKEVFYTTFIILLPILGVSLIVGVFVSVFQAATSIQEQTLTFVPKILATAITIVFTFPWIIEKLISFTVKMLTMFTTVLK